jgi:hypothetical protein
VAIRIPTDRVVPEWMQWQQQAAIGLRELNN